MTIAELKRVKDQRPFQPFVMRTADGQEIPVSHPDAVAWDENARLIALCIVPGRGYVVVNVSLVTTLDMPPVHENGNGTQESN